VRIARILTRLNLGGPARQALASDPLLVQRGHVLRVFAGTPAVGEGDLFDEMRARGVDVERVPGLGRQLNMAGDLRALHALRKGLEAFAPDVVHTHAAKAGAVGRRAARVVPRAARVHTFHGHVLEGYFVGAISKSFAVIERHLSRETDRIVAVSHATADDLVRLKVLEDEKKLVVVQVFTLLARAHPRLHLVFVGDGSERGRVERLIHALPDDIRPRAHLVGARPDMRPVLADLDLVLLTSRSEGLPVALIEAAAAGKPVVATNVGGVSEIVAHERTGWLGTSVDELAFGLAQYLEAPPAALQALGVRSRLRASTRHSADALATRLAELYQAVVEERACAS
jgi:glycosyltransferase involved in cell wall biosynthesis